MSANASIFSMLRLFQLKSNELLIYNMLSKKPMTIKQLQKSTKMSERSLRTHLDDLVGKNFVRRTTIEDVHLKYIYSATSGENLLGIIKKHIEDIEKIRKKARDEIIKGTEEFINK